MELLNHRDIPAKSMQALRRAVQQAEKALASFEALREEVDQAKKQVPSEKQAPTEKKKLEGWTKLREDRLSRLALLSDALRPRLTKLQAVNGTLRQAIEAFRALTADLF